MGALMVRCPQTGKDFASGIETDPLSFELTPAFSGTIRCPLCGVDHQWSKIDAWVAEDAPSPSSAAAWSAPHPSPLPDGEREPA